MPTHRNAFPRRQMLGMLIVLLVLAAVALLTVVLTETLGDDCPHGTTRTKGVCIPNSQLR